MGLEVISFTIARGPRQERVHHQHGTTGRGVRINATPRIAAAAERDTAIRRAIPKRSRRRQPPPTRSGPRRNASLAKQAEAQRPRHSESTVHRIGTSSEAQAASLRTPDQRHAAEGHVEQVKVQQIEKQEQIKVQESEILRHEKELIATILAGSRSSVSASKTSLTRRSPASP
jgi:flotillin